MEIKTDRRQISTEVLAKTILLVDEVLKARMKQKGEHAFVSIHEILGIVDEEHDELKDAVRENNPGKVQAELIDIAVGAIWGIASIEEDVLDW